ncbi:hypothetical protein DJ548_00065 [Klebsiella grimontii]|nr:hypothetical protein DMP75_13890 [Klebsiella michiganensis]MBX4670602.1 hypothetical protein [Klebsiella sp. CVUAS 5466.2]MBX4757187.1 hypothetical protein [Klebsiella sp. CVUAS 8534.2]MBX4775696.1 hypothetical protein [Klebsiella sp. CVUAS 10191.3]RFP41727.1 hypothetical protein DDJ34_20850 [Klebsiella oxytoca]TYF96375.1 hypothetical protein DJ542_00060 [Klebsiella grimontii]
MGTRRILRIPLYPVNAFSSFLNRLLQKSPIRLFLARLRVNQARHRQLPPFFCTRSSRDSWFINSSSEA